MTGAGFQTRLMIWFLGMQGLFWLLTLPFWFTSLTGALELGKNSGQDALLGNLIPKALQVEVQVPGTLGTPAWLEFRTALEAAVKSAGTVNFKGNEFFLRSLRDLLFVGALQGVLAVGLSLLLSRSLSRPLRLITQSLVQTREGNQEVRLPPLKGREFSLLGREYNRLLDSLQESQRRLAQAANLAGWQETARFLSHQIKNPLTSLGLAVQNLQDLGALESPLARENALLLQEESQRLVALVDRLKELTGFGPPEITDLDLKDLCGALAQRTYPVPLSLVWEGPSCPLKGDRMLFDQVFLNFFQNAAEAAAAGGRDRVTVRIRTLENSLEISDGLSGLSTSLLEKIFRPPFTTKTGGNGLGLLFARKILEIHGADLEARLTPEGGLLLRIKFKEADNG